MDQTEEKQFKAEMLEVMKQISSRLEKLRKAEEKMVQIKHSELKIQYIDILTKRPDMRNEFISSELDRLVNTLYYIDVEKS